jgi:hypothetical protein
MTELEEEQGGLSSSEYDSFNFSDFSDDDDDPVIAHFMSFTTAAYLADEAFRYRLIGY